ncbi:hypothetical protein O9993_05820 [Vibrio lentus]|nr:hypothetical protein [Vibrio lentus]
MLDFAVVSHSATTSRLSVKATLQVIKETALGSFDQSVSEILFQLANIYSELEVAEKNLAGKCQAVGATVISFNFI